LPVLLAEEGTPQAEKRRASSVAEMGTGNLCFQQSDGFVVGRVSSARETKRHSATSLEIRDRARVSSIQKEKEEKEKQRRS